MVQSIYILSMPHELSIFRMTASGEPVDHIDWNTGYISYCWQRHQNITGNEIGMYDDALICVAWRSIITQFSWGILSRYVPRLFLERSCERQLFNGKSIWNRWWAKKILTPSEKQGKMPTSIFGIKPRIHSMAKNMNFPYNFDWKYSISRRIRLRDTASIHSMAKYLGSNPAWSYRHRGMERACIT